MCQSCEWYNYRLLSFSSRCLEIIVIPGGGGGRELGEGVGGGVRVLWRHIWGGFRRFVTMRDEGGGQNRPKTRDVIYGRPQITIFH